MVLSALGNVFSAGKHEPGAQLSSGGGQGLFLRRTFETLWPVYVHFPWACEGKRKCELCQNLKCLKISSPCTVEWKTKGRINGNFPWMSITGARIWVFYGVIKWLKDLWRWLYSEFLLLPILYVRGNEWDFYAHPHFIIQELGSQWSGRSVSNKPAERNYFPFFFFFFFSPFFYIMYNL